MKVISYNVNGIRSALSKGLADYLAFADADVVCLQETKAESAQVDLSSIEALGYKSYWFSAAKKGYSGVAILSRIEPKFVDYGCGDPEWDREGRVIRADFSHLSVMSVYFPSGSSGDHRQDAKFRFLEFFMPYVQELRKKHPNLLVCGDYNICHRAIDIHDPKGNKDSSGFLPEERHWMETLFGSGFSDTYRHFYPDTAHQYSWWSFRANARNNNKGWRIDYIAASESLIPRLKEAGITQEARHSDHCPVWVELKSS
jgi:exodeoxyribonuclease-3